MSLPRWFPMDTLAPNIEWMGGGVRQVPRLARSVPCWVSLPVPLLCSGSARPDTLDSVTDIAGLSDNAPAGLRGFSEGGYKLVCRSPRRGGSGAHDEVAVPGAGRCGGRGASIGVRRSLVLCIGTTGAERDSHYFAPLPGAGDGILDDGGIAGRLVERRHDVRVTASEEAKRAVPANWARRLSAWSPKSRVLTSQRPMPVDTPCGTFRWGAELIAGHCAPAFRNDAAVRAGLRWPRRLLFLSCRLH